MELDCNGASRCQSSSSNPCNNELFSNAADKRLIFYNAVNIFFCLSTLVDGHALSHPKMLEPPGGSISKMALAAFSYHSKCARTSAQQRGVQWLGLESIISRSRSHRVSWSNYMALLLQHAGQCPSCCPAPTAAVAPASTGRMAPVIHLASADARKRQAWPTSLYRYCQQATRDAIWQIIRLTIHSPQCPTDFSVSYSLELLHSCLPPWRTSWACRPSLRSMPQSTMQCSTFDIPTYQDKRS
jgi:hypothetical protein